MRVRWTKYKWLWWQRWCGDSDGGGRKRKKKRRRKSDEEEYEGEEQEEEKEEEQVVEEEEEAAAEEKEEEEEEEEKKGEEEGKLWRVVTLISDICSMKRASNTRSFPTPPGWDASPLQVTLVCEQAYVWDHTRTRYEASETCWLSE